MINIYYKLLVIRVNTEILFYLFLFFILQYKKSVKKDKYIFDE